MCGVPRPAASKTAVEQHALKEVLVWTAAALKPRDAVCSPRALAGAAARALQILAPPSVRRCGRHRRPAVLKT
jgi:hypothetical protein